MLGAQRLEARLVERERLHVVDGDDRGTPVARPVDERLFTERVARLQDVEDRDVAEPRGQPNRDVAPVEHVEGARPVAFVEDRVPVCITSAATHRSQAAFVESGRRAQHPPVEPRAGHIAQFLHVDDTTGAPSGRGSAVPGSAEAPPEPAPNPGRLCHARHTAGVPDATVIRLRDPNDEPMGSASIRDTALLATALLLFGAETAAADGPIAPARPSASSSTPAPAAIPTTTKSPAPAAIPTTTPTATPAPTTTTTTTDDRGETSEPDLEAGGGDRAEAAGSPSSVPTGPWSAPVRPLDRPVVVLYGDSLAWEARHVFEHTLADEPVEVVTRTFGGTAICDWLDEMADDAATLRPGLVILEFVGNNYTPCMQDASGAPVVGQALVDRYGDDAAAAVATFASADTEVVFAGAPISQPATATLDLHLAPLNAVYEELARELDGVGYTDAGAAVLDDGTWTATLPCLRIEPCADGDGESGAGHNVVRAPDGLHFCPANEDAPRGVTGDCPVWSSGAFRFGAALAEPVLDRLAA